MDRNVWRSSWLPVGRRSGMPGLPESDDWTACAADEIRAAVEYLQHLRVR